MPEEIAASYRNQTMYGYHFDADTGIVAIDIVNITLHLLLVHSVTCFVMQPLPMNHSISFS